MIYELYYTGSKGINSNVCDLQISIVIIITSNPRGRYDTIRGSIDKTDIGDNNKLVVSVSLES